MNLSKAVKVARVLNGVAAGTTEQTGSVVDTQGFEGVQFVALFGALTATQVTSLKVQQGSLADGSDMAPDAVEFSGAALAIQFKYCNDIQYLGNSSMEVLWPHTDSVALGRNVNSPRLEII